MIKIFSSSAMSGPVWSIGCCVIFTRRHNWFFSSTDFINTMIEEIEDNKNGGSSDLKALPNDIPRVSIEQYLKDCDNDFKVVDVRTREEYCEDRWEMIFESCF